MNIDFFAFFLVLLITPSLFFVDKWRQRFDKPSVRFSSLSLFPKHPHGWRPALVKISIGLEWGALIMFLIAFINPHQEVESTDNSPISHLTGPTEGIGIYLVLDRSTSMESASSESSKISKLARLKQVTEQFIKEHPSDMIGLISFSRGAQVQSPLTLDHQDVIQQVRMLSVEHEEDQKGTSIGYAIYKAASLIASTEYFSRELQAEGKPAYDIKNTILVAVTDGIQEINPLDSENKLRSMSIIEAAEYAKQMQVRCYLINIEPQFSDAQFAPHMRQMKKAAELTGGEFYLLRSGEDMSKAFKTIDQIEKSKLPPKNKGEKKVKHKVSFSPYFIAIGLTLFGSAFILNRWFARTIP